MSTSKKTHGPHNLTGAMLKRLAQLAAGITPNYGTSMAALASRGLVDGYATGGPVTLTQAGREAIEQARAAGW
jgi:hypothetical protein